MAWTEAHVQLLKQLDRRDPFPFDVLADALAYFRCTDRATAEATVNELLAAGVVEEVDTGLLRTGSTSLKGVPFPEEAPTRWALGQAEWDAAVAAEHERQVRRVVSRLEIVDGLRRGLDLGNELHDVVRRCADRGEARAAVIALGFSEPVAEHLLDLRVGQQTELARADLDAEAMKLREELERLSPPGREGGTRT